MSEPVQILLLFLGGMAAGLINVFAGGGALITMPLLIFFGVPPINANATVRLSTLSHAMAATWRFQKMGVVPWADLRRYLLPVMIGTFIGSFWVVGVGDENFKTLLGWVTVGAGLIVASGVNRYFQGEGGPKTLGKKIFAFIALVGLGWYAGGIQAGYGYVALAVLTLVVHHPLSEANVMKTVIVFPYSVLTILIFQYEGLLNWHYGIVLALGQALGGWLGAGRAVKGGEKLIRGVLLLVLSLSALRLLILS